MKASLGPLCRCPPSDARQFLPAPDERRGRLTCPASPAGPRISASTSLFLSPPRRRPPPSVIASRLSLRGTVIGGPRRAYHQGAPGPPPRQQQALARRVRATLTCGPGCPVPTRRDGLDGSAAAPARWGQLTTWAAPRAATVAPDTRCAAIGRRDSEAALFYAPGEGRPFARASPFRTPEREEDARRGGMAPPPAPLLPTPALIVRWLDHCCFDSLCSLLSARIFAGFFFHLNLSFTHGFAGAFTVGLAPFRSNRLVQ